MSSSFTALEFTETSGLIQVQCGLYEATRKTGIQICDISKHVCCLFAFCRIWEVIQTNKPTNQKPPNKQPPSQVIIAEGSINTSPTKTFPNCYANLGEHIFLPLIMSIYFFVIEIELSAGLLTPKGSAEYPMGYLKPTIHQALFHTTVHHQCDSPGVTSRGVK